MITGELKNRIDGLWDIFAAGGLVNPLDVIEQITYLMFIHDLDTTDNLRAKESAMLGLPFKSIFADEMEKRGLTPVIASHNLRELEDICDHVGLLHKGGVLLSKELLDMKCNIQKVQCVFSSEEAKTQTMDKLTLMKADTRGQLNTLTVRGSREEVLALFGNADTVFYEVLPLSLEEIFISETEVVGYDIKKLILG